MWDLGLLSRKFCPEYRWQKVTNNCTKTWIRSDRDIHENGQEFLRKSRINNNNPERKKTESGIITMTIIINNNNNQTVFCGGSSNHVKSQQKFSGRRLVRRSPCKELQLRMCHLRVENTSKQGVNHRWASNWMDDFGWYWGFHSHGGTPIAGCFIINGKAY